MPIELPNLDDRTYQALLTEAIAALPQLHPGWTDHNPSNPGIALVELFAWLTEMVLYKTNQVPERSYETFLKLLNGPDYKRPEGQSLQDAIAQTRAAIRERYRAVSAQDYEELTMTAWPGSEQAKSAGAVRAINRVRCLAETNLDAADKLARAPGHMSLIVVPSVGGPPPWPAPEAALVNGLKAFFRDRKLLTTRVHVSGPAYVPITVSAKIYLRDGADEQQFPAAATNALLRAFHAESQAADQPGWPFGRDFHTADVYAVLDRVRGIDFVDEVVVTSADAQRLVRDEAGSVAAVRLHPHELPQVGSITLQVFERRGNAWQPIA